MPVTGDDLEHDRPTAGAVQAELLEAFREMLQAPRMQPGEAADRLRRRFGIEGIYVEDGSEVAWPLRRLLDGSS